jgi:hypothetical protein
VLKVFYVKSDNLAQLHVAVETKPPAPGTPATFTPQDPVPWLKTTFDYNNASFTDDRTQGRLQIALNFDGGLQVTAIKASAGYAACWSRRSRLRLDPPPATMRSCASGPTP